MPCATKAGRVCRKREFMSCGGQSYRSYQVTGIVMVLGIGREAGTVLVPIIIIIYT